MRDRAGADLVRLGSDWREKTIMPKRTDANQAEIVEALREIGANVTCTHAVGHGFPDLVVSYGWKVMLLEVKTGEGKLTPAEMEWAETWQAKPSYAVVRNPEQAIKAVMNGKR